MNKHDHIRAVIFDIDGTLFDTLPTLAAAANEVLMATGLRAIPAKALRPALSAGLGHMFRHALALQNPAPNADVAQNLEVNFKAQYYKRWLSKASPYAEAANLITTLQVSGLRLGVCTNRDRASTELLLQNASLRPCFEVLVGLGDTPLPKPAADPLLLAISAMGLSPAEALFVGDSIVDARCAQAAGVRFAAHSAGYADQATDLLPHVLHFDSYSQLKPWVLERSAPMQESSHG